MFRSRHPTLTYPEESWVYLHLTLLRKRALVQLLLRPHYAEVPLIYLHLNLLSTRAPSINYPPVILLRTKILFLRHLILNPTEPWSYLIYFSPYCVQEPCSYLIFSYAYILAYRSLEAYT
jgi:hypothetical protein